MCKYDVVRKTEIRNVSQHRQRRTKPLTAKKKNQKKIGEEWTCSVVGDLLADRRTHRQTDTLNTVLRFRGAAEVTKQWL